MHTFFNPRHLESSGRHEGSSAALSYDLFLRRCCQALMQQDQVAVCIAHCNRIQNILFEDNMSSCVFQVKPACFGVYDFKLYCNQFLRLQLILWYLKVIQCPFTFSISYATLQALHYFLLWLLQLYYSLTTLYTDKVPKLTIFLNLKPHHCYQIHCKYSPRWPPPLGLVDHFGWPYGWQSSGDVTVIRHNKDVK